MTTLCYTDKYINEKIIISYRNRCWKIENFPGPNYYQLDKYAKFIENITVFMNVLNNTTIEEA
ncbi:MAG: hypothetical protein KDH96_04450 [Candidatus Riesia sp.]|nr:hypothetical protein [Candidatus Riesia sp.]